jgi:hypothetical protein
LKNVLETLFGVEILIKESWSLPLGRRFVGLSPKEA